MRHASLLRASIIFYQSFEVPGASLAPATCPPLQEPGEEPLACGFWYECVQAPWVPGLNPIDSWGRWKLTAVRFQTASSASQRPHPHVLALKFQNLIITPQHKNKRGGWREWEKYRMEMCGTTGPSLMWEVCLFPG